MMKTISALLLFVLSFGSFDSVQAQNKATTPRIGVLSVTAPPNPNIDIFVKALQDYGYTDGKNIAIDYRYARGKPERMPELAADLVRSKVDAIFAVGPSAMVALKQVTGTIPIAFFSPSDPVGLGVVASLAHPGGNFTGVSALASDLWPKRLELLKEISPKLSRVAMVWKEGNAAMNLEAKATQEVAEPLGVALQDRGIKDPAELEGIFAAMAKDRPDSFLTLVDPVLTTYQKRILDFLIANRLPAIFESKEWVEAGGLVSYGPNYPELYRRAAFYMDKILKGAKPADLPVEQPTQFELVINLKTAKALGLTIPQSLVSRADEVIH